MARKIQRAAYIKFGRVMRAALRALWQRTSMKLQRWWYRMVAVLQTTLRARRLRLALLVQGKLDTIQKNILLSIYSLSNYHINLPLPSPHPSITHTHTHHHHHHHHLFLIELTHRIMGKAEGLRRFKRRCDLSHPPQERDHHPASRQRLPRPFAVEEETRV